MIRLKKVGMSYSDQEEVLKDIDLVLKTGSFHFLTGPSGAGKSSLLKLLHLAHLPSRGKMEYFGENVNEVSRKNLAKLRQRIGYVFQDFRLLDHLTAIENVSLPLRIMGGKKNEIAKHAKELLEWVGLKGKTSAYPKKLSGGEKQRIAIARAVITKPQLLLADEPTGNVDPEMADRIMSLFMELNKMGTTTVIATHDPNIVTSIKVPALHIKNGFLTNG